MPDSNKPVARGAILLALLVFALPMPVTMYVKSHYVEILQSGHVRHIAIALKYLVPVVLLTTIALLGYAVIRKLLSDLEGRRVANETGKPVLHRCFWWVDQLSAFMLASLMCHKLLAPISLKMFGAEPWYSLTLLTVLRTWLPALLILLGILNLFRGPSEKVFTPRKA